MHRWQGDERTALREFIGCSNLLGSQNQPAWRARTYREIAKSYAALGDHARAEAASVLADATLRPAKTRGGLAAAAQITQGELT